MKHLSDYAAQRCEQATQTRCRCRCGGALHGAKRGGESPSREFFENLPESDPHHISPEIVVDGEAMIQTRLLI